MVQAKGSLVRGDGGRGWRGVIREWEVVNISFPGKWQRQASGGTFEDAKRHGGHRREEVGFATRVMLRGSGWLVDVGAGWNRVACATSRSGAGVEGE